VDDSKVVQEIQFTRPYSPDGSAAVSDNVPVVGFFGLASNPPLQSDVIVVRLFGSRTLTVAIGTNNQAARLKNLAAGDSALYDVRGAYVWLTPAGPVIDAAGGDVVVQNAATVTVKASTKIRCETPLLQCTGDVVANCDTGPISLVNHPHSEVASGLAESGPPVST
jgi:phage gp45-like